MSILHLPNQVWGYDGICRFDLNLAPNCSPVLKQVTQSVACVVDKKSLVKTDTGYTLSAKVPSLQERVVQDWGKPLTETESFQNQLSPGIGTAFLIHRRYLMTAAHVVSDTQKIVYKDKITQLDKEMVKTFRFVFGFQLNEQGECKSTFAKKEVYKGKVVAYKYHLNGSDFALIKLNRLVDKQRIPLRLDTTRVQTGDALTLIEHGEGLPM